MTAAACALGVVLHVQELTKSMSMFGYDILQALVNDIAPDSKVSSTATATWQHRSATIHLPWYTSLWGNRMLCWQLGLLLCKSHA